MARPTNDRLAEAFQDMPTASAGLCPVGRVLTDASEQARDRVNAWFAADPHVVSGAEILRRFQQAGYRFNKDTVSAHRRGACRCQ
jgi:hypothetical protein